MAESKQNDAPTLMSRLGLARTGTVERKTVTFGDGSAITGGVAYSIGAVIALAVLWFLSARYAWIDPKFLPGPGQVWERFVKLVNEGYRNTTLWEHTRISLTRMLWGFGLGTLVGVPIGFAMGLSNFLRGVFDPIVEFFRPIPPLAFIPLVILLLGIGEESKIILLFFAALWIMIIATRSGVLNVKLSKVHAAYSLGASKMQILTNVILPNALPEMFTGMRVALGVCWGTLVAAELVGGDKGLGAMIWIAQKFFLNDVVIIGIILIGIIGVAMDYAMRALEGWLIPWRGKG